MGSIASMGVMNIRDVPDNLRRRIRIAAAVRGISMRKFILEVLEKGVGQIELFPPPKIKKPRR